MLISYLRDNGLAPMKIAALPKQNLQQSLTVSNTSANNIRHYAAALESNFTYSIYGFGGRQHCRRHKMQIIQGLPSKYGLQ